MPRVIISSGHSTANPGITANGLTEYEVARKIAKYALKYIRQNGVISLLIPPNMELAQRIEWINKTGYMDYTNDVAVEIHINDGNKRGIEIWHEGEGPNKSHELADYVNEFLVNEGKLTSQGVKSEYLHELGSISFVHEVNPIACLIECCYIDNTDDANLLKQESNLDLYGKCIAKGIMKYMKLEFREIPQAYTAVPPNQFTPNQAVQSSAEPSTAMAPGSTAGTPVVNPAYPPSYGMSNVPAPATINQAQPMQYNYNLQQANVSQTNQLNFQKQAVQPAGTVNAIQPQATAMQASAQPPSQASGAYGAGGSQAVPMASAGESYPGYTPQNTREDRKKMITDTYIKILGREPNPNDLNYFLNIGTREDELIRKMIDSQEHADLVKARQEVITIKKEFTGMQSENLQLKAAVEDQKNIIASLTASIAEKNFSIAKYQKKNKRLEEKQAELINSGANNGKSRKKYKGTFKDKVFRAFSDVFE